MSIQRVIIEIASPAGVDLTSAASAVSLPGIALDPSYPPVPMPALERTAEPPTGAFVLGFDDGDAFIDSAPTTVLVRADLAPGADPVAVARELMARPGVAGVYADIPIEPCASCPGSTPIGTDADVARLLDLPALRRCRMDGRGVTVAIVDTGINLAYLQAHGKAPGLDAARSWVPRPGLVPGQLPVGHGTMCAYDVCIAAPRCTLLDIAVLQSNASGPNVMSGVLSDAVRAYQHLYTILRAPRRAGENPSLVVNNSWGMFHPSWDYPVGHPGNYSDNPKHPFNRIVATLVRAGADVLFAAGNCGPECPDGRCGGVTTRAIYGANSHPDVITVAGVDVNQQRLGYSSIGPGRLHAAKPDLCGYTHFAGSGVYAADGGTSAATPVVAGVVAALRAVRPYNPASVRTRPPAVKALIMQTARDLGAPGFDREFGTGVVNGTAIAASVCRRGNLCDRYPWLCWPRPRPPLPRLPPGPRLPPPPVPEPRPAPARAFDDANALLDLEAVDDDELDGERAAVTAAYWAGYQVGRAEGLEPPFAGERAAPRLAADCGCRGGR